MPVELKGSCHCGALCLCSICRKVGGVGGSITLGGYSKSLKVEGEENLSVYSAVLDRDTPKERIATSERHFCKKCSSMLWVSVPAWPEVIRPFASAIDSPELESPETMTCILLDSKPAYVRLPEGKKELYEHYCPDSLEDWHKKNGLYKA